MVLEKPRPLLKIMLTPNNIPFFGVNRQYNNIREEILEITDQVYSSGRVLGGTCTKHFEEEIGFLTNRKYTITVNSGTQALIFALRAIDHKDAKDKVIIPAQSFVATANAVYEAGFEPVFCDVDRITGLIDIDKIPVAAEDVAAVIYVNLFGNVIDYDKLTVWREFFANNSIPIIEDAAQSLGASWKNIPSGRLGDISCLSFDPTKNLNNYGSGGMILTDTYKYVDIILDLRDNGKNGQHIISGTNSKMSEADCGQMLVKLKYFKRWQARRAQIAEYYTSELRNSPIKTIPVDPHVIHAWSKYVVHVTPRMELMETLRFNGIETKIHYEHPLHLKPMAYLKDSGILEGAEEFSKTCLSLPIYPELLDSEVEHIIAKIVEYNW